MSKVQITRQMEFKCRVQIKKISEKNNNLKLLLPQKYYFFAKFDCDLDE